MFLDGSYCCHAEVSMCGLARVGAAALALEFTYKHTHVRTAALNSNVRVVFTSHYHHDYDHDFSFFSWFDSTGTTTCVIYQRSIPTHATFILCADIFRTAEMHFRAAFTFRQYTYPHTYHTTTPCLLYIIHMSIFGSRARVNIILNVLVNGCSTT